MGENAKILLKYTMALKKGKHLNRSALLRGKKIPFRRIAVDTTKFKGIHNRGIYRCFYRGWHGGGGARNLPPTPTIETSVI